MNIYKSPFYLVLLISLLTSNNTKKKTKNVSNETLENLCTEFKLKCIHSQSRKILKEKDLSDYKEIVPLLKDKSSIRATLKMLYLINYKERFDQHQIKRTPLNNFTYLRSRKKNPKKQIAYKNTETINSLYQLHQLNYYSDKKNSI